MKYCYCVDFTKEETEGQISYLTCPRSRANMQVSWDSKLGPPGA